jgi:hypothetical protein
MTSGLCKGYVSSITCLLYVYGFSLILTYLCESFILGEICVMFRIFVCFVVRICLFAYIFYIFINYSTSYYHYD